MYKSIDLFAGIGGIRRGFDNAFGKDIKTVFLITKPEYNFISSSAVREILVNKGDISAFVPNAVHEYLKSL